MALVYLLAAVLLVQFSVFLYPFMKFRRFKYEIEHFLIVLESAVMLSEWLLNPKAGNIVH